jgi:hypothetical protein
MNVVAPGITLEDYNGGRGKPIDLFEGRIKHWILAYAKHLAYEHQQKEHAGIAVLILASSVFEPLGGVLPSVKRLRNSEAKFCNGFVRVFPKVTGDEDAWQVGERVCDLLRNGLFHEAFVKRGLVLTKQEEAILVKSELIFINAVRFLDAVESAFAEVCNEIRAADDTAPIRRAFEFYQDQLEWKQAKKVEPNVIPEPGYLPVCSTSTLAPGPVDPRKWIREL